MLQDFVQLIISGPAFLLDISEILDIGAYSSALLLVLPLGGQRYDLHLTVGACVIMQLLAGHAIGNHTF